ncbi:hypothetical protein FB451DRAFT_1364592 [Mycena latifolia]|nr:hypothetical protein FB451DRAFT_1364592 [Mycena latifolia]
MYILGVSGSDPLPGLLSFSANHHTASRTDPVLLPQALPFLTICINAARSCSHVVDISNHRKNGVPVPVILGPAFMAAIILLLNVWSGKRTGLLPHLNSALTEVHKCMESIRVGEDRCTRVLFLVLVAEQRALLVHILCFDVDKDLLSELAAIGELPLPRPTPSAPASEPAPPAATTNAKKRARNDNAPEHPRAPTAAVVRYPPYADAYAAAGPTPVDGGTADGPGAPAGVPPVRGEQQLVFCADVLGAAGGFKISITDAAFKSGAGAGQGEGYAPGADYGFAGAGINGEGMRSDMRAMWANAPTGFEVDEWGTYFSVMSDLYQGKFADVSRAPHAPRGESGHAQRSSMPKARARACALRLCASHSSSLKRRPSTAKARVTFDEALRLHLAAVRKPVLHTAVRQRRQGAVQAQRAAVLPRAVYMRRRLRVRSGVHAGLHLVHTDQLWINFCVPLSNEPPVRCWGYVGTKGKSEVPQVQTGSLRQCLCPTHHLTDMIGMLGMFPAFRIVRFQ